MPSSATITAFYTFVADTKARAAQVNANFDNFRGHFLPIEPLTSTASDILYDLGSVDHSWRNGYMASLRLRNISTTVGVVFKGITTVTAGAAELLFGSSTICSYSSTGMKRRSLESANDTRYETVTGTGSHTRNGAVSGFQDITGAALTISVQKGPIEISLRTTTGATYGSIGITAVTTTVQPVVYVRIVRDGSVTAEGPQALTGASGTTIEVPPSSFRWYDNPGPGTYTYALQSDIRTSSSVFNATNVQMSFREL